MFQIITNKEYSCQDTVVIGVFDDKSLEKVDKTLAEFVEKFLKDEVVKKNELISLYTLGQIPCKKVCLLGLGNKDEYSIVTLNKVLRKVNSNLGEDIAIIIDSFVEKVSFDEVVSEIILTVSEYNYRFTECKSQEKEQNITIKLVSTNSLADTKTINEAFNIATSISNARDLVNKPYNYLNASDLANYAVEMCETINSEKLTVKIFDKKEIEKMSMQAFLGVNKGSTAEPKLIYIKYQGKNSWAKPIALVGKGLMFDTGGYSLKSNMCDMKDDMAGAATVLGAIEALAKNNIEANVSVVIAATDNRINGEALLPDDVLTSMNGKTIEIVSTDAEGRLTLADAITFAQKEGANEVIDVATLTGACVVALGDYIVGAFGNCQCTMSKFLDACKASNEQAWQLPINDEIRQKVRSSRVADLTNSTGRNMGASGAAAFLEEFIEKDTKWIHLDIAGPAFHTAPVDGKEYGATGVMVKSIYNYIKRGV